MLPLASARAGRDHEQIFKIMHEQFSVTLVLFTFHDRPDSEHSIDLPDCERRDAQVPSCAHCEPHALNLLAKSISDWRAQR
jgi:hypothetical protein